MVGTHKSQAPKTYRRGISGTNKQTLKMTVVDELHDGDANVLNTKTPEKNERKKRALKSTKLPESNMEAEEAGSSRLTTGVSWPCIGCRTSFPSVVKSNVAFLNTGGSSRLAVHTTVLSAPPARKIPTAYPLRCGWNPKAYRPEGDSHDKFEPGVREEPGLILNCLC
ncbi:hypothetical protein RJ639_015784 [Escallonia herrerae]|uniref:Uncharacterized protein n=1 Tax=Escallonia herrerae TaxID=1293975 RepID=A0AA88VDC6_9ASTE|nr:hypothetical protein RJ639_015784 [Escallonia herrerae]